MTSYDLEIIVASVLGIGGLIAFAALIWLSVNWYERTAKAAIQRIYGRVGVSDDAGINAVCIRYYTYHGFLLWFTQTEHNLRLSPEKARELLRRLRNYNLTWGIFCYGMVFVPLLAFGNYFSQLREIRRQENVLEESRQQAATPESGSLDHTNDL